LIASLVSDEELNPDFILPLPFDQESEKQLLQQLLKQQEKPELQEYKTKIKIYDTKIKKTGKGFTPLPVFLFNLLFKTSFLLVIEYPKYPNVFSKDQYSPWE